LDTYKGDDGESEEAGSFYIKKEGVEDAEFEEVF